MVKCKVCVSLASVLESTTRVYANNSQPVFVRRELAWLRGTLEKWSKFKNSKSRY